MANGIRHIMQASPRLSVIILKVGLAGFGLNVRQCLAIQISAFLTDDITQIFGYAKDIVHNLIRILKYIYINTLKHV